MQKCLQVAQCVRQLNLSSTTNQDQPSVLGLNPQQVMELMPLEMVSHKNTYKNTYLEVNSFFCDKVLCVNLYNVADTTFHLTATFLAV